MRLPIRIWKNWPARGVSGSDLYYGLNTFTIRIPPLRERPEDIFEMVRYFLNKYNRSLGMNKKISPAAFDFLLSYCFPGNVRERESMIKRAVFLSDNDVLDEHLIEIAGGSRQEVSHAQDRLGRRVCPGLSWIPKGRRCKGRFRFAAQRGSWRATSG